MLSTLRKSQEDVCFKQEMIVVVFLLMMEAESFHAALRFSDKRVFKENRIHQ